MEVHVYRRAQMIEFLDEEKDTLAAKLRDAASPAQCRPVLEEAIDRILLKSNGEAASDRHREAAAFMLQVMRAAVPLVDTAGDIRIWRESAPDTAEVHKARILLPAGAGCALCAALIFLLPLPQEAAVYVLPLACLLLPVSMALVYFAGKEGSAKGVPGRAAGMEKAEITLDADKACRILDAAILTADQNLKRLDEEEAWLSSCGADGTAGGISPEELQLWADLLEASLSGDPDFLADRMSSLRYYLHKRQVDVIDYSEDSAEYFDLLPSMSPGTLRPALMKEGKLLKRGLAAGSPAAQLQR